MLSNIDNPGNPSIYSYFDENSYQRQAVIAGC